MSTAQTKSPLFRWVMSGMEILLKPFIWFQRKRAGATRRIGVLEVNRLGDVELMLPALQELRRRAPSATIVLIAATSLLDLVRDQSCIDERIPLDVPWMNHSHKYAFWTYGPFLRQLSAMRRANLDVCLDTRGDLRRHMLMALAKIPERVSYDRFLGGLDYGYRGRLLTRVIEHPQQPMHRADENRYLIQRWLNEAAADQPAPLPPREIPGDRPLRVALHVESHWPNKTWEDDRWIAVLQRLQEKRPVAFSLFSASQVAADHFVAKARAHGIAMETVCEPLAQLRRRLSAMDLYLGVDSGPMHVADTEGCRIVSLFGPSDIGVWHAYRNGPASAVHRQDTCPYAPCRSPWCRTGDTRCMTMISVDQVMDACEQALAGPAGATSCIVS